MQFNEKLSNTFRLLLDFVLLNPEISSFDNNKEPNQLEHERNGSGSTLLITV